MYMYNKTSRRTKSEDYRMYTATGEVILTHSPVHVHVGQ